MAEHDVFVADAGNRIVWHYDASGRAEGRIGDANPARTIPGFLITSHYFDLAVGSRRSALRGQSPRAAAGRLHVPGRLGSSWGKGSPEIEGFFGCCNPAHIAVLPDGRFVTAEKGLPRIKVYSRAGKFECVVAGPREMPSVTRPVWPPTARPHPGAGLDLGQRAGLRAEATGNGGKP